MNFLDTRDSMIFSYKTIILLILLAGLVACENPDQRRQRERVDITKANDPSPPVELPEPSVGANTSPTDSRFKLTELSAINDKFIKITENIIFSGIEKKITVPFDEISMKIKSHCILNTAEEQEKVVIREYDRKLTAVIPLIEILPVEVLRHKGTSPPTCGFSFKATNKEGSAHHFELPQLPIVDYSSARSFSLINVSEQSEEPLVHLFSDRLTHYMLNTGPENPVQKLDFVCDDFSLPLLTRQQQFIPVPAFPFNSLSEETITKIRAQNPFQDCRILGYNNNTLKGVSAFFKLVYPAKRPIYIQKTNNPEWTYNGDFFHAQMVDSDGELKKNPPDTPLYSITISNHNLYPVSIFIQDQEKRDLPSYSFYQTSHETKKGSPIGWAGYTHYDDDTVSFSLNRLEIKAGEALIRETREGTLVTMQAHSHVQLSVILNEVPYMCHVRKKYKGARFVRWIGTVFEYPELNISQLVSDKLPPLAEQNTVQKLNTTDFKDDPHFSILSSASLVNHRGMQELRSLLFRAGRCFQKPSQFDYNDPILNVYREGNGAGDRLGYWRTKWLDMHFSEEDYNEMNSNISLTYRPIIRGL